MPTTDPIKRREVVRRYYLKHKEKVLAATRKWQDEHKEVCLSNKRAWKKANPDKVKAQHERWWNKNPDRALGMFRGYSKRRRATVKGNLVSRIAPSMARSLREGKGGRAWESLVGYTVDDLRVHIEKHFLPGMSWENKQLWHIDHKIPKAAFNYETTEDADFKRCWALKNLQPLWAAKNISKKDRIDKPFQPSLLLSTGG